MTHNQLFGEQTVLAATDATMSQYLLPTAALSVSIKQRAKNLLTYIRQAVIKNTWLFRIGVQSSVSKTGVCSSVSNLGLKSICMYQRDSTCLLYTSDAADE